MLGWNHFAAVMFNLLTRIITQNK